jgi:hypothetical protein
MSGTFNACVLYEKRDLWIGVYWDTDIHPETAKTMFKVTKVYICIVPCFPILLTFGRTIEAYDDSGAM